MAETPKERHIIRMADHIVVYTMTTWYDGNSARTEIVLLFNNKHKLWHCVECSSNDCAHAMKARKTFGG